VACPLLRRVPSKGNHGSLGRVDYYTTLVRTVEPGQLARAAFRRVARLARARVRPEPVAQAAILASFGAQDEASLATEALGPSSAFCDASARPSVMAALDDIPGARQRALDRARTVARGETRVFGRPAPLTVPVDWRRDPRTGHRWGDLPADRIELTGHDPKRVWAVARLDSAVALAQGVWVAESLADQSEYSHRLLALVQDFIQANPPGQGIHWTNPMEVALRALNLAMSLRMVGDRPEFHPPEVLLPLLTALEAHGRFVEAQREDGGAVPNNQVLAEDVALAQLSALFPGLPSADGWARRAPAWLRDEVPSQVHPDGVTFEDSTGYQRLVVELLILAELAARTRPMDLGPLFGGRLRAAFQVVAAACTPSGRAVQFGDDDGGRALPFTDRHARDHGWLAGFGAAFLGDPELKAAGEHPPDEVAWCLGMAGVRLHQSLAARRAARPFHSAGGALHVLRVGRALLAVSAGPVGQGGVGGHSHNDRLSFELHVGDTPLVVDRGCLGYLGANQVRDAFRSVRAHNTLQIDDQEQSRLDPARPFALLERARARVLETHDAPTAARLEAEHTGYRTGRGRARVRRSFVLIASALRVMDVVEGHGTHRFTCRLHLPDREARLRPATFAELARAARVPGVPLQLGRLAVEVGPSTKPRAVLLVDAASVPGLQATTVAPAYGEEVPAMVVVWMAERSLPLRTGCVILWDEEGR
jgi:Heparinase II/III-like protein/Heparinase II/III N-terminus